MSLWSGTSKTALMQQHKQASSLVLWWDKDITLPYNQQVRGASGVEHRKLCKIHRHNCTPVWVQPLAFPTWEHHSNWASTIETYSKEKWTRKTRQLKTSRSHTEDKIGLSSRTNPTANLITKHISGIQFGHYHRTADTWGILFFFFLFVFLTDFPFSGWWGLSLGI